MIFSDADHRADLLAKLRAYATSSTATERDRTCAAEFMRFVGDHADCFERTLLVGHVTASAWLLNADGTRVLLTHHRKLDKWLQLGGHCDGDSNTLRAALREAQEESGIDDIRLWSAQKNLQESSQTSPQASLETGADATIFDIDIHPIPANRDTPAHLHYDVRYVLCAPHTAFVVSEESLNLAWIDVRSLAAAADAHADESVVRMAQKWLQS
jgi:8-oxo-dGTP pyrophosphatase MutT (NUDIX family)